MKYDPAVHHRRSIRWKGHDYHEARPYFVTICTQKRLCLFGNIEEDTEQATLRLSVAGIVIGEAWRQLEVRFPGVLLDEWVLMPNHLHGIVVLSAQYPVKFSDVIHDFKSWTTTLYSRGVHRGEFEPFENRLWHRNYFERVVRDDAELQRAREYISNNPNRWLEDKLNPANPLKTH